MWRDKERKAGHNQFVRLTSKRNARYMHSVSAVRTDRPSYCHFAGLRTIEFESRRIYRMGVCTSGQYSTRPLASMLSLIAVQKCLRPAVRHICIPCTPMGHGLFPQRPTPLPHIPIRLCSFSKRWRVIGRNVHCRRHCCQR